MEVFDIPQQSKIIVVSPGFSGEFDGLADAVPYLAEHTSVEHFVNRRFSPEVIGMLVEVDDLQHLQLFSRDGRRGLTPRYRYRIHESGVSVSTAPEPVAIDVIVHVAERSDTFLDRGLSWVQVYREAPPELQTRVNANHGLSHLAIFESFRTIDKKAVELVDAVLESDPNPPHARR